MFIQVTALYTFLLSLSVIFTFLSLPGNEGYTWLTWFCLSPIIVLMESSKSNHETQKNIKSTWKDALLLGGWGLFWWCSAIWWIIPASVDFIGINSTLSTGVCFALALSLSVPYFICGYLWPLLSHTNVVIDIITKSALLTSLIGVFSWVIPANLANSLFEQTLSIQIVSITGVSGLLFVVLLVNIGLAKTVQGLIRADYKKAKLACTSIFVSFSLLHLYGYIQLNNASHDQSSALSIAYIQPSLERSNNIHPLIEQTEAFIHNHPEVDLIVWPELPIIFSWQENRSNKRAVNQMLAKLNKPLLLNSGYVYPEVEQRLKSGKQYFSTVQLISADGLLQGNYSKQILVPFFEYLPFEASTPEIREYFPNALKYIPGINQTPIAYNLINQNTKQEQEIIIAPLICYEMIFSRFPRKLKKQGASIFINPSNDTWFSHTTGSIRHFALALFRSVENRTPWVRVNNSGISGATTAYGEIINDSLTSLNTMESKVVTLSMNKKETFYSRFGEVFWYLTCLFSLLYIIKRYRKKSS